MSNNEIPKDFLIEVQQGNIPGYSMAKIFGRNNSVENNVWSIVSVSIPSGTFPQSGSPVRIKAGGNPADSPSGVGARSVSIRGLSTDLTEVRETIATSGANASAYTTNSFWRIYRSTVITVGMYNGSNVGEIIIENSEDMLTIAVEEGESQHGAFVIPSGHTGQIVGIYLNADGVKPADFRLMARFGITNTSPPIFAKQLKIYWDGVTGYIPHVTAPSLSIPALTDVWIEARGGGANTEVSVGFDILLKKDDPGHLLSV
jgi:hypothetical protein